jgi:hypothetical protein
MLSALAALVLLAAAGPPPEGARPEPARPGLSWADADSLSRKLQAIDARQRTAKPGRPGSVAVTEGELNSYLNLSLKMPAGVSDVEVHLQRDGIFAKGLVDLERLQGRQPSQGPWSPFALLSGKMPVELKGRLQTQQDGFATVELEEVRVGPVKMPPSFVGQVVASATRTSENPQGFDILSPFRLPYSLKRVRIGSGQAVLEY